MYLDNKINVLYFRVCDNNINNNKNNKNGHDNVDLDNECGNNTDDDVVVDDDNDDDLRGTIFDKRLSQSST